ncbi:AraC family transcriptional regulator [Cypionkella aquatica]|uniref:AraC family transcriptional regulator n=1 Tax=Cypionkella aquatica TaxID=1756042 RepID=A0AA37TX57_9RHOB|nr:AraC family transcriptional regulator [Cypionkella aquatica]GLS88469.1 AraC family transcriptional regulator [Cypionkella aquatica]
MTVSPPHFAGAFKVTSDAHGCPTANLSQDQALAGGNIQFFRKASTDQQLRQVATPPSDRGLLIGIALQGNHRRQVFREHHAEYHDFEENAIYIRDFNDSYRADLIGPFEFLLLEIAPQSLQRIAEEADVAGVSSLNHQIATKDPVLGNLSRALIPAFERPAEASALFLDQMATAIGTYIVQQYGNRPAGGVPKSRRLSRAHENLAKAILLDDLDGDVSIAKVAEACNLSRGYFIRAFRDTTGQTPYQWLVSARIRRACDLLRAPAITSLAEVAVQCGFNDQSHFTRVFASVVGTTPGAWRRDAML